MLDVKAVRAGYGGIEVLHEVNLHVPALGRVGLFGPNGHGKTTLLRAISGLVRARAGAIRFEDAELDGMSPRQVVELGVVHVPQGSAVFPEMTVEENLLMGSYAKRARRARGERFDAVYEVFPLLRERRRQLARTLSGGERQMMAVGIGLMTKPRFLMLDEPTLGLAPKIRSLLAEAVLSIAQMGVTMLVVDQDVEFLLSISTELALLEQGQIAYQASADKGVSHADVVQMYFGRQ